jgi:hypothetical protein
MTALGVRQILRPRPALPSISHFGRRNPLPLCARVCALDTPRFRITISYHQKPLFSRHCSFHHAPPISTSSMSSGKALDHFRLPTDLRPTHYDLTIRTDLEKERFAGFVKIECVMYFGLQTILTCF